MAREGARESFVMVAAFRCARAPALAPSDEPRKGFAGVTCGVR